MIRLIAIITMIFAPIISVSTTGNESETVFRSNDLCDQYCEAPEKPTGGGGGGGGSSALTSGGSAFSNGSGR